MRRTCTVGILVATALLAIASTTSAQMHPGRAAYRARPGGYGGYGDYGDYGAWGAYSSAMNYATSRNVAQSSYLAGQNAAMQQRAMMQSGIRNSMMSQAQTRTQDLLGQQQSNRDWWFQVQQQQSAQRQYMASRAPMSMASAAGFESAVPAGTQPQVANDVIKWLPVLCDPRFVEQRAAVEAPYRRTPKAEPTTADYQNMIEAAQQMKTILGRMTGEISAQEYLNAEKYLDQLAAEARGRIEKPAK